MTDTQIDRQILLKWSIRWWCILRYGMCTISRWSFWS